MIGIRARSKELAFIVDVDPNIPKVLVGDDVRLNQVIINLLTNAVKYTQVGEITLKITGKREKNKELLTVSVKDTGNGIKEEDIPKLFSEFERIEEERNRHIEGTGLGLNIVNQLLSLMNSKLNVESQYGIGSNFYFTVEQGIASVENIGEFNLEIVEDSKEDKQYEVSFTAPNARVLVVDDNNMNRKVFMTLLKDNQIQIDEADRGTKCLELVKNNKYDIIFMDHMMPELDGIETLHRLKAEDNLCKDVPVIILTANAVEGYEENYLKEGFVAYLSKPVEPEKLEDTILKYLPKDVVKMNSDDDEDEENKEEENSIDLPVIEDFDWNESVQYLMSADVIKEIAILFREEIDEIIEVLVTNSMDLSDAANIDAYRIKAHSTKSSLKSLGNLRVSEIAKECEFAARDKDISKITELTPVLIEELMTIEERLKVL